ncbi:MAG: transposase, partial [Deltaproteobacteria bacterium]|nr:transposase [Deltaproteobacteria bacterium]
GAVTECLRGQAASTTVSGGGDACNVHFDRTVCGTFPCAGRCPVSAGKRSGCGMRYRLSGLEAARNRSVNGRPENVGKARQRNGVEAAASETGRVTGTGRLRFRGTVRAEASNNLKIAVVNIRRALAFWLLLKKLRLAA